jgi:rSAM/selenodomain-associated transferase 1
MIAARAPIPGQTKTRLGVSVGMDAAADLYRAFLIDLANRFDTIDAAHLRRYDLAWTYSPPERDFRTDLEGLTGRSAPRGTLFVPQDGPDWGTRQSRLLRWGQEQGYDRTVLMASDSPHLSVATIAAAFDALDEHDVVMGRVRDGGYYLIGMVGFVDVLTGVRMSTASAADGVVEACHALGLSIHETEPTFDIDESSDLAYLIQAIDDDPGVCPATRAALVALDIWPGRNVEN